MELCLLEALPDVLGEGEDADVDGEVIVPSRRWSGCGPGERGVVWLESVV
jgi:hypothetical protein